MNDAYVQTLIFAFFSLKYFFNFHLLEPTTLTVMLFVAWQAHIILECVTERRICRGKGKNRDLNFSSYIASYELFFKLKLRCL